MSNGNYSTSVIVTCRECGAFDCRIIKGLCEKHYKRNLYLASRVLSPKVDDGLTNKQRRALYYIKNKERLSEKMKEYREKNSDAIRERKRVARSKKSPELLAAERRASYLKNKDKCLIRSKIYTANNKQKVAKQRQEYWSSKADEINAERAKKRAAGLMVDHDKVHTARRRAAKKSAGGTHTAADVRKLKSLQKYRCAICHSSIKDGYHLDHIMPLALGGSNGKENIQLLCPPCNQLKHAKDPIDHMQSLGFLL